MTQEEKQLLLRDLCSRLPYGVKISVQSWDEEEQEYIDRVDVLYSVNRDGYIKSANEDYDFSIEDIKPYLFPLSSISEEIMDEIYSITGVYDIDVDSPVNIEVGTTFEDLTKIFDILNKHHIDYRGMIPKGLAVDATNLGIYGSK